MTRYTLSQIRKSFNAAADTNSVISRYILRPFSFYITFLVLKVGTKPNQATLISLVLGLASLTFFIIGEGLFFGLGVLFYISYIIFDFVDGNIARVTDSATYYGKFLDGAVDVLIESLLAFSVGMGVYRSSSGELCLFGGIAVTLIMLYAHYLLNRASFYNRWVKMEEANKKMDNVNPLESSKIPIREIVNFSVDFRIIVLLAGVFIGMSKPLFLAFLASIAVWAVALIISTMLGAANYLNIHRKSKMAS